MVWWKRAINAVLNFTPVRIFVQPEFGRLWLLVQWLRLCLVSERLRCTLDPGRGARSWCERRADWIEQTRTPDLHE